MNIILDWSVFINIKKVSDFTDKEKKFFLRLDNAFSDESFLNWLSMKTKEDPSYLKNRFEEWLFECYEFSPISIPSNHSLYISGNHISVFKKYLVYNNINEKFDDSFFSFELGHVKEDPLFFEMIKEKINNSEDNIYVDDDPAARLLSKKAGFINYDKNNFLKTFVS